MATNGLLATNPLKIIPINIYLSINTSGLVVNEGLATLEIFSISSKLSKFIRMLRNLLQAHEILSMKPHKIHKHNFKY